MTLSVLLLVQVAAVLVVADVADTVAVAAAAAAGGVGRWCCCCCPGSAVRRYVGAGKLVRSMTKRASMVQVAKGAMVKK